MPPQSCLDTCTLFGIKTYMHVGVSVCAYTESSHGGNITLVACPLEGCCDVVCAQNEHQVFCEEDLWKFMFATVSCTTSWLLLLPSCPHCLLFSSTWFFCTLSLSVDANMFLVVFFLLSALSFLSYPRFKSQNNVESFHSNATLSLTPISNRTQICFFRSVHLTQTVTLPVWWTHTQTHTHTERQQVSLSWNLPARGMWYCGKRPKGSRQ